MRINRPHRPIHAAAHTHMNIILPMYALHQVMPRAALAGAAAIEYPQIQPSVALPVLHAHDCCIIWYPVFVILKMPHGELYIRIIPKVSRNAKPRLPRFTYAYQDNRRHLLSAASVVWAPRMCSILK